jgi:myo-inositol-1-phosphate synthase
MRERYSIEVTDEIVEIYGDLTIEEAFDFLSFFERKGYKSLVLGSENSTLRMMKRDQKEEIVDQRVTELKDEVSSYKRWLEKEQEKHEETKSKLKDVERLLKDLMSEEYKKYKALYDENQKIIRSQMLTLLEDNPEVQEIIEKFKLGADPEGTKVPFPFDWTYPKMEPIPNCCSTPEKQEAYENLVQLKNDFPHIPIPSPSDFYINPDPTKE